MNSNANGATIMHRCAVGVLAATLTVTLASCSSSKDKSGTPSGSGTSTTATTATTAASSASKGLTAADTAAITAAYTKFFNTNTSLQDSMAVLQDGPAFKDALVQQAASPNAQGTSATVSKVLAQTPNTAVVTFTILIKGSPVLKDTSGYAVRENGMWKVAGGTFCGLLTLNGGAPPVCKTAAATALPN